MVMERFKRRFRVELDVDGTSIVPCKGRQVNGTRPHVYRFGTSELAYVGVGRQKMAWLLKKHPGVFTVWLDCEDEFILRFAEEQLPEVTKALGCRMRRQMSKKERERVVGIGEGTRFRKLTALKAIYAA